VLIGCSVRPRAQPSQRIPGWPYSFVAALEPGRTSWTALLDAVRLGPADDATAVTADQIRAVVERLIGAGHWRAGDPHILIVTDAGYDITRLACLLAELPVELLGRIRSDRVLQLPTPHRLPGTTGRPPRHGPEFALGNPRTWPPPQHTTTTHTTRYGTATATSWDRLHPRLTHRDAWAEHPGELPVIAGTLIRLQVEHLPGDVLPLVGKRRGLDRRDVCPGGQSIRQPGVRPEIAGTSSAPSSRWPICLRISEAWMSSGRRARGRGVR